MVVPLYYLLAQKYILTMRLKKIYFFIFFEVMIFSNPGKLCASLDRVAASISC